MHWRPGGGFVFWGSIYGPPGDPEVALKSEWLADEYEKYGRNWYKNH